MEWSSGEILLSVFLVLSALSQDSHTGNIELCVGVRVCVSLSFLARVPWKVGEGRSCQSIRVRAAAASSQWLSDPREGFLVCRQTLNGGKGGRYYFRIEPLLLDVRGWTLSELRRRLCIWAGCCKNGE